MGNFFRRAPANALPVIGGRVFATFNCMIVKIAAVGDFIMVETEDGAIVYVDEEGRKHLLPIKPR